MPRYGFSSRAKGEEITQSVIQLWLNVSYLSVGRKVNCHYPSPTFAVEDYFEQKLSWARV
jgi:hypothetical protein